MMVMRMRHSIYIDVIYCYGNFKKISTSELFIPFSVNQVGDRMELFVTASALHVKLNR